VQVIRAVVSLEGIGGTVEREFAAGNPIRITPYRGAKVLWLPQVLGCSRVSKDYVVAIAITIGDVQGLNCGAECHYPDDNAIGIGQFNPIDRRAIGNFTELELLHVCRLAAGAHHVQTKK